MSGYNSDEENYNPHHHAQQGFPNTFGGFGGAHNQQGGAGLGGIFGGAAGPGGLFGPFGGLAGGFGGHMNAPAPPSAFNRTYRAYSSAFHEIQHGRGNAGASVIDGGRAEVMFGGQIMMPPSALRHLTELDIEGPWTFELVNTVIPDVKTHAGVLEFTADEGVVNLPSWIMKRLSLVEGDPVRLFGTRLPKGKFVKLQPQSVTFLELSDPKAVLEQAMRAYTVITPGDIIEIHYNSMTFELLVMEVQPDAAGISVLNTDLEVDFAPPVGYVEPERKPAAPIPTMKTKLNINVAETQDVDARGSGTSTPVPGGRSGGAATPAGRPGSEGRPAPFESFKGKGYSMAGKRVNGKGIIAKPVQAVDNESKIWKTSEIPKIVTADTQIGARKVPAALNVPEGTLFFGFTYKPAKPSEEEGISTAAQASTDAPKFSGQARTLSGRAQWKNDRSTSKKEPSEYIQIDSD